MYRLTIQEREIRELAKALKTDLTSQEESMLFNGLCYSKYPHSMTKITDFGYIVGIVNKKHSSQPHFAELAKEYAVGIKGLIKRKFAVMKRRKDEQYGMVDRLELTKLGWMYYQIWDSDNYEYTKEDIENGQINQKNTRKKK